jgi:hypothetical protein
MRKREMVAVLGCFLVCVLVGGAMLFNPSVGSPVAMNEAGMVVGSACYQTSATRSKVCSNVNTCSGGTCGCSDHYSLVQTTSGGYSRKDPETCNTDARCTAVYTLKEDSCGGG